MNILLLGSTGSIGTSTLRCVERYPERFVVTGLAANRSVDTLLEQANRFGVSHVAVGSADHARALHVPAGITLYEGEAGLVDIVRECDFDVLVNALVGSVGLAPTAAALLRGKRVALANKETLVAGGDYINSLLDNGFGSLVPIDSEHSAILQAITGEQHDAIESIVLTASGGPFRLRPAHEFASITPEQALDHPTWTMGAKITIDCATLMNKGFEVIEAHHIFRLGYDKLRVVIHPQSIIHSLVEFHDGAMIAQMGIPDMELPIQYALTYPVRFPIDAPRLNLASLGTMTFFEPDLDNFPCLRLCLDAGKAGGTAPTVVNAANEVAVALFLEHRLSFPDIAHLIEQQLERHTPRPADSLETIAAVDRQTREAALSFPGIGG